METHETLHPSGNSDKFDKSDKRASILEAMQGVVAEYGFHSAPMALVAQRAGVGAGTIYRYFANKEELIVACYHDIEERMRLAILADYQAARPVRERFLHLATGFMRHLAARPREFSFLLQFHDSPFGARKLNDWILGAEGHTPLLELFREGIEQRLVKNLPLPVLLAIGFGPMMDVCRDHAAGILAIDDRLIVLVAEACWDGLKR